VTKVTTTCPYCGVGCNFDLNVRDGKVVKVTSNWAAPANKGALCVKGRFGWQFLHSPDRLTTPLVRKDLAVSLGLAAEGAQPAGDFVPVSWDVALDIVAGKLWATKEAYGPDAIGVLSSAKCVNEENYLMQKLVRAVIGTNNVDHCARL
jgi:predicted molibdopterin-dependent oxidoreductase YjgC